MLGTGGFGYVVLARDPDLDRLVAVKFVLGGAHGGDALARLQREGRALAALRHPGVLPVYEAVAVGEDVALVTGYAEGGDLAAALTRGHLPVPARLDLLDDVAAGLAAVHHAGIVHRDLKPANVFLTDDGRAMIGDFGLARLGADASAFRTEAGVAAGTPFYAAPEQLTDPDVESPRLDWYSFAVIAHRTMLGELPGPRPGGLFSEALSTDPAARLEPTELVRRLREVPAESWPRLTAAPADAGDEATNTSGRVEAPPQVRDDATPATSLDRLPDDWVDVPVFASRRPARWRVLVPAGLGLLIGLIVAVVLVLLRS